MHSATKSYSASSAKDWAEGLLIAAGIGIIYLAVRPPLFDLDGYGYRLSMLGADRLESMDHLHLLWEPMQMLMLAITQVLGSTSTVPFQVFGILVNCATLFFFWGLLHKVSGSRLYASSAAAFVAFSPRFWYLGFQNEPYPLLFLAVVLYLAAWRTSDGGLPSRRRQIAAAVCLAAAILVHQAAVFLLPAGMLALTIFGDGTTRKRLIRALIWGAGIGAIVGPAYVFIWHISGSELAFLPWTLGDFQEQHFLELPLLPTLIKSLFGATGAVVQSDFLQSFLAGHLSKREVYALYGALGLAICAGLAGWVWWTRSSGQLMRLARTNALFTLSILSIFFWSVIIVAKEPVTPNYWVLDFFPALVCLGFIFRDREWHGLWTFAAIAIVLSVTNGYLNRVDDLDGSRNDPEVLLASVDRRVAQRDLFIVLANADWYGNVEYELLFRILENSADHRGVAILNDFVLPANGSDSWQAQLGEKIKATMDAGGQVYVGAHVLDPASYSDLAGTKDPFSPCVNQEYVGIDGQSLRAQIEQVFAPYDLEDSDFKIGNDDYFVLKRKP
jgi:hypothetical protein